MVPDVELDPDDPEDFDPFVVLAQCPKCSGEAVLEREILENGTSSVAWDDCPVCDATGVVERPDLLACLSCTGTGLKTVDGDVVPCGICQGSGAVLGTDKVREQWEALYGDAADRRKSKVIKGLKPPDPDKVKFR